MDKIQKIYSSIQEEDKKELDVIESYFHLSEFSCKEAIRLGNRILTEAEKFGPVVIQIVREDDGMVVFQAAMDGTENRNFMFAEMKRQAVKSTGHCSFYKFVESSLKKEALEQLFSDHTEICAGGAFPIYVNDEYIYTITTSGLKDGQDFTLVVNAMRDYLGQPIPRYHGELI